MDSVELLQRHMDAMYRMDETGRLLTVNEPWNGTEPAPLLHYGCTIRGERRLWLRQDVEDAVASALMRLFQSGADAPKAYADMLRSDAIGEEICYAMEGAPPPSAGCFMATADTLCQVELGEFAWLQEEISAAQPCALLLEEGVVASVCRSVRIGGGAHEAGIETLPIHQGKGYAGAVLSAWAQGVRAMGCLPLYSTSPGNRASQRVAEKGGLRLFATGFHVG